MSFTFRVKRTWAARDVNWALIDRALMGQPELREFTLTVLLAWMYSHQKPAEGKAEELYEEVVQALPGLNGRGLIQRGKVGTLQVYA